MSNSTCTRRGAGVSWRWEGAFDKIGYDDGDGPIPTQSVVDVLEAAGYRCKAHVWGRPDTVIASIKDQHGAEVVPATVIAGYDDPRTYLPSEIIELLDRALPVRQEVVP